MERATQLKKIPAAFYQSGAGREPVREWLKARDAEDRKVIGEDMAHRHADMSPLRARSLGGA